MGSFKRFLSGTLATGLAMVLSSMPAFAVSNVSVDFEPSTYLVGNIDGQDGWLKTGPFDAAVVSNTYGYTTFGTQSLRISDAVTSGSFGDQVFAKPLDDAVGETTATAGSFTVGTRQTHFEAQFDLASTVPGAQQPGMHVSVSPDRGDGSRMSYLRFEDGLAGIDVFFDDVSGTSSPVTFNETQIATGLNRAVPHNFKLTMDVVEGPSNDVVKVWIDGALVHTGKSWENYYLYDAEASAEQSRRIVKTLLFRVSGASTPANIGKGFLFDNLTTSSLTPVLPSVPVITTPSNNSTVTTSALTKIDWTDSTGGTFTPYEYQYEAFGDSNYTVNIYSSSWLTSSEIPTPGTPPGDYYVRVRARDAMGNVTDWSNGSGNAYKITVVADPVLVGPATNKDQCKKDGWKTFNNPTYKNQGDCVSAVASKGKAGGNPVVNLLRSIF